MKNFLLLLFVLAFHYSFSQVQLNGFIGLTSLPADGDSICQIPVFTGNFNSSGLQPGDTISDFTFYKLNGDSINIANELLDNKPILLVAGSYTCPVFRNKLQSLNNIYNNYSSFIKIFVIYTVEAHPSADPSPYSGTIWVTSQNQQQGILYPQPKTYGERKAIVSDMLNDLTILPTVIIDGPCNEWWSFFGPAPNNAYLIKPDGVVFTKHGWFDKSPQNMACDIDSLLGNPCGNGNNTNGIFNFFLTGSNSANGSPGDIITINAVLENNSAEDAEIAVVRTQNNVPVNWQTAMCIDVCLPTWVDSTYLYLPSGTSQSYIMYFYTDSVPGSGQSQITFSNLNIPANVFVQNFYASTNMTAMQSTPGDQFNIWFNNAEQELNIINNLSLQSEISIFEITGREIFSQFINRESKISLELKPGIYFYNISDNNNKLSGKFLVY